MATFGVKFQKCKIILFPLLKGSGNDKNIDKRCVKLFPNSGTFRHLITHNNLLRVILLCVVISIIYKLSSHNAKRFSL